MGKCGAFMLQNLVTMVKRSRAKGSPLYRGEPEGIQVRVRASDIWQLFYEPSDCSNLFFFLMQDESFQPRSEGSVHIACVYVVTVPLSCKICFKCISQNIIKL